MSGPTPNSPTGEQTVADYDADSYDYRDFWSGRDYEHWAETRVLQRLLNQAQHADWLVDLGGGFGRHIPLYKQHANHVVLVDYSRTNLENAQATLLPDGPGDGSVYLVRGNLYRLPFRDGAFEIGTTTRVIHHLRAIDDALTEMGRVLSEHWVLDVPIKNHLLARARALTPVQRRALRDPAPQEIGTADTPFLNFHLETIRQHLAESGWSSTLAASVNNFRRWNRVVPRPLEAPIRPVVNGMEVAAQRVGRGWWGPAQFLWLTRERPLTRPAAVEAQPVPPAPWDALAARMVCPTCQGTLEWTSDAAFCSGCNVEYRRKGAIWDFVVG